MWDRNCLSVRQVVAIASAVTLLTAWSACCKGLNSAAKESDEAAAMWLSRSWSGQYDWTEVQNWKYVNATNMSEAESLLRGTPSTAITQKLARHLIGEESLPEWNGTTYLFRAVGDSRSKLPNQLFVRQNGDVWIGGQANSKCPVPRYRRALVAWLNKPPTNIYVTFNVNRD